MSRYPHIVASHLARQNNTRASGKSELRFTRARWLLTREPGLRLRDELRVVEEKNAVQCKDVVMRKM